MRARARERGIPLTIANPATAIGQGQFLGLASVVSDLWHGRLPAVPGGREVFVPVVDVGYLAAFLAALPGDERTEGQAYWILDDRTPSCPISSNCSPRTWACGLPAGRSRSGSCAACPAR
ncbi:hypothetical protein ACFQYP_20720 [Nonomuraea antimicrobica]